MVKLPTPTPDIMEVPVSSSEQQALHDEQSQTDLRAIPINRVGIKDIRHPIQFLDRSGKAQPTVAQLTMTVNLPPNVKGTHMSRFVQVLQDQEEPLSLHNFHLLLEEMTSTLEADEGQIDLTFPFFVSKTAPISKVQSFLDYQVSLSGIWKSGKAYITAAITIPVTSLCPCSKGISDYGAHNQRSHITIRVTMREPIWVEELIDTAEAQASCELYGLLKRPDEKYVTEYAYDNPKFVEDMVRDIAVQFNEEPRILSYRVESENFESIHNHSAYACIERNKAKDTKPGKNNISYLWLSSGFSPPS